MINNTVEQIKKHFEQIMELLDIEKTPDNELTPLRISKMWCNEFFANRNDYNMHDLTSSMKIFPVSVDEQHIIMTDIKFWSNCAHHWLPFGGTVNVEYIPDKFIIGLSKIPRVVEYFSKRPQLQERLTKEIGDYLFGIIQPKYLRVEINAKHQCVMCRGVKNDCETVTYQEWGDK